MSRTDIPDVPDVSARWYLNVVAAAARLPGWVQQSLELATDAVVVGFALALVLLALRARRRPAAAMAVALAGPASVLLAYALSEAVKGVYRVDRPCRTLDTGPIEPIAHCPELGDWSFPSNHATIAGAAAVAIWWSSSRWGPVAAVAALLAAASRVIVGVHYPHDVLVGSTIGAATAGALVPLLAALVRPYVERLQSRHR